MAEPNLWNIIASKRKESSHLKERLNKVIENMEFIWDQRKQDLIPSIRSNSSGILSK